MAKSRARKLADIIVGAGIDIDGNLTFDGGSTSADLTFADNDKANFGDASDLQIYHDSSHSYIQDAGSGNLYLRTNGTAVVIVDGTDNLAAFNVSSGEAALYYGGSGKKLATTSTGVTVTGQLTATSDFIAADSGGTARGYLFGTSGGLFLRYNSGSNLQIQEAGSTRVTIDTGGNVGIGTTSPGTKLAVKGTASFIATNSTNNWMAYTYTDNTFRLNYNGAGADEVIIDSSGNVGIGAVSLVSGDKLTLNGNFNLNGTLFNGTSNNSAGINFTSNFVNHYGYAGIRFYAQAAGIGSMAERMRIDSSGHVLIGQNSNTGSANADNLVVGTGSGNNGITILSGTTNGGTIAFADADADEDGFIAYNHPSQFMQFGTAAAEQMRITSAGRVGINESSPDALLHITGQSTAGLIVENGAGNASTQPYVSMAANNYSSGYGTFRWEDQRASQASPSFIWEVHDGSGSVLAYDFRTGATGASGSKLAITQSGNVGIGTVTPGRKLTVQGGSGDNLPVRIIGGSGTSHGSMEFQDPNTTADYKVTVGSKGDDFYIQAGGGEKVRILANGNVGIGTTAPAGRLDVQQNTTGQLLARVWNPNTSGTGTAVFRIANSGNNAQGNRIEFTDQQYYHSSISADRTNGIQFGTNATGTTGVATERMRIDNAGNVGIGTTSPNTNGGTGTFTWASPLQTIAGSRPTLFLNSSSVLATIRMWPRATDGTSTAVDDWHINAINQGSGGYLSFSPQGGGIAPKGLHIRNTGSVGVGTVTPDALFEVESVGSDVSSDPKLRITAQTYPNIEFYSRDSNSSNRNWKISSVFNSYGTLEFLRSSAANGVPNVTTLAMNNAGNVGIGTSSPSATGLHISQNNANAELTLQRTGTFTGNFKIYSGGGSTNRLVFRDMDASSDRVTIDSSGNVGIGTAPDAISSNATTLNIKGLVTTKGGAVVLESADESLRSYFYPTSTGTQIGTLTNHDFLLMTNSAERMRIDGSTKNVGIGTSTLSTITTGVATLSLGGTNAGISGGIAYQTNGTPEAYHYTQGDMLLHQAVTGVGQRFLTNNTERMRIDSSGNVGINQPSPTRKLHVTSAGSGVVATFGDSLANNTIEVTRTTTNASYIGLSATSAVGGIIAGPAFTFSTCNSGGGSVTERMRIDASGNVGIGTSTAVRSNVNIHGANRTLASTTSQFAITASDSIAADIGGSLHFGARYDTTTADFAPTGYVAGRRENATVNNYAGYLQFGVTQGNAATIEAMRIDSSGNVGINATTVAANGLQIGNTSSTDTEQLYLYSNKGTFALEVDGGNNAAGTIMTYSWANGGQGNLRFKNASGEVARFDASGNVLVGKTSADTYNNTNGIELQASGLLTATRTGIAQILNREDSDGDIAVFRKDGSTVGSIGAYSSRLFIGSGDTGIFFDPTTDDAVKPWNTSTNAGRDAAIDLGDSGTRFKALYLSSTAHIGNTKIIPTGSGGNFDMTFQTYSGGYFERARITGDGNLLVGTTDATPYNNSSGTGLAISSAGQLSNATHQDAAMLLNRMSTDGSIIDFKKDGTTVGSIGVLSSRFYIGSGDTGLKFSGADDLISPIDASDGTGRDAAIDLGSSGARFKDLHLSSAIRCPDYRSEGVLFLTYDADDSLQIRKDNGAEAARFDSSGNLLVGTTAYNTADGNILQQLK